MNGERGRTGTRPAAAAGDTAVVAESGGDSSIAKRRRTDADASAGAAARALRRTGETPADPVAKCPHPRITRISLASLAFLSDHRVLESHDSDWEDGGAVFDGPHWTPDRQHPLSHTMGEKVRVRLEIDVEPADARPETVTLAGAGPGRLRFRAGGLTIRPGRNTVTLESTGALERVIQALEFAIAWTIAGAGVALAPARTRNTMFVTMGPPSTPPDRPGVTLRRMRHAVEATGSARSLEPHAIVAHVIGRWGTFNLQVDFGNGWKLADDRLDPQTGRPVGADCQTIVRYTRNVIAMVGCPGRAEFVVVWAEVGTPQRGEVSVGDAPSMADPKQFHNEVRPQAADPARAGWYAVLEDHDGEPNNYEACLRFTHPDPGGPAATRYYAGGAGTHVDADAVITVFRAMVWFDLHGQVTAGDPIHVY